MCKGGQSWVFSDDLLAIAVAETAVAVASIAKTVSTVAVVGISGGHSGHGTEDLSE